MWCRQNFAGAQPYLPGVHFGSWGSWKKSVNMIYFNKYFTWFNLRLFFEEELLMQEKSHELVLVIDFCPV